MSARTFLAGLVIAAAVAASAAPAQAGRFEDFTRKAAEGKSLQTLAATFFGGPGLEEFVAAGGQSDGTIVVFGNAWGPIFPAAGQAPIVLGKGRRFDVPDTRTDQKGRVVIDRSNPNVAGFIVRYSSDLRKVLGAVRFDWGVASIETGVVMPDGCLVIAGRCTEAMRSLVAGAPCATTPRPAEDLTDGKKKEARFGPCTYEGAPVCGDVYVARMSADGQRFVWVHLLEGHRQPPPRLLVDGRGNVVFECDGIKRISADGRTLTAVTASISEGDRVKLLAVNPKDGTMLHGGDRNTRTNREPWRQPFLNCFDPSGNRLWRIWDWDPKSVGSDAKHLESDSAVRAAAFAPDGQIVVAGWSDGGNSVFTRKIKDLDAKFQVPGFGMSSWGMKGANSLAYLMKFDPRTFEFSAWTLWVSYLPQGPDGKGGNPNFANVRHLVVLDDGSVLFAGQAATGLIQTPGAWFKYPAEGGRIGGHYVAVFNHDFTDLVFSSYLPACEVQGLGVARSGLLVVGRSTGKDDQGNAPPIVNAVQQDFGGGHDGHVILLQSPVATK